MEKFGWHHVVTHPILGTSWSLCHF